MYFNADDIFLGVQSKSWLNLVSATKVTCKNISLRLPSQRELRFQLRQDSNSND